MRRDTRDEHLGGVAVLGLVLVGLALIGTHRVASAEEPVDASGVWWGGWNASLGGDASGGLALVLRPPNRSTVFAADAGGRLRFRHWNGSRWTDWQNLAVPETFALDGLGIDAVATTPDRIDLVVRDERGHVRQTFGAADETTNRWAPWRDLCSTLGPPAIVSGDQSRVRIFAMGPNGILLWRRWERDHWLNEGRWDWIKDREGEYPGMRSGDGQPRLSGQIAVVQAGTPDHDRLDLIALTTENRVVHTYWNGSHWSGFADISGSLGGQFSGPMAITSPDRGRLELLARLDDGTIQWKRWADQWLQDWAPLSKIDTHPGLGVGSLSPCRVDVVARDSEDEVRYGYTRCEPLARTSVGGPAAPLKVFFQNMALLVFPGRYRGLDRVGAIDQLIERLKGERYDLVGLAEVFDNDERERISNALAPLYPSSHRMEGPDESDLESDGGLLLLSRHPIVSRHQVVFDDFQFGTRSVTTASGITAGFPAPLCRGADCWANKGILHARIEVPEHPRPYDVYLTHLQNDNVGGAGASRPVTLEQVVVLRRFVEQHSGEGSVSLIMGDFNLDAFDPAVYAELRGRLPGALDLWNVCEDSEGPGMTSDGLRDFEASKASLPIASRDLLSRRTKGKRIDYIFVWARDPIAYECSLRVATERFFPDAERAAVRLCADQPLQIQVAPCIDHVRREFGDGLRRPRDISDHYGLRLEQKALLVAGER